MADASLLQQNPPQVALAACATLTRILTNVVEHPTEPKFRRIKLDSGSFQSMVWNVVGGRQFLFSVGWTIGDGCVQFEPHLPIGLLKDGLSALWVEERVARRRQEEEWLTRAEALVRAEGLDAAGPREADVQRLTPADLSPNARVFLDAPDDLLAPAVRLFGEVLGRIVQQPAVPKFRRINPTAPRFAFVLDALPAALALLQDLGFVWVVVPPESGPSCTSAASSSSASSSSSSPSSSSGGQSFDDGGRLVLPDDADVGRLRAALLLLQDIDADITLRIFEATAGAVADHRAKRRAQPPKPPPCVSTAEGRAAWQAANERALAASLLISEIAALMHFVWSLEGEVGYVAHHRKEQRRLLEEFKSSQDFGALHRLKEEWEARLEETKVRTGKSLLATIPQSRYATEDTGTPADTPNPKP